MAEFLGEASASGLCFLTAMPLGAAFLIVVLLIYFHRDNSQKSGLGSSRQPSAGSAAKPPNPSPNDDDDDLDISILSHLRSDSPPPPPTKTEPSTNVVTQMDAPPDPVSETRHSSPVTSSEPTSHELLSLRSDPETGQLIVQIGEQHYTKLIDISDKQVGRYILELTAHLLAFTNGMYATEAGVKSVRIPKTAQLPTPPFAITESPPPDEETPPPEPSSAWLETPPARPRPTVSVPPKTDSTLLGGFNLAGEINEIVQNRLTYSPLAATTNIEISTAPSGGIQIEVNGKVYESAEDVSPPEAKKLIKEAIKQWERS